LSPRPPGALFLVLLLALACADDFWKTLFKSA
jgi:hypothetical protein